MKMTLPGSWPEKRAPSKKRTSALSSMKLPTKVHAHFRSSASATMRNPEPHNCRLFKSKKAEEDETEARSADEATKATVDAFPDADASITTGRPHEEFATRRGGRRRRRPAKRSDTAALGAEGANGHDEEAEVIDEPAEIEATEIGAEEPEH